MNPIVNILNIRSAEKQVRCIQHQSAIANKALIVAFVAHQNYLGNCPRTKDIVAAMNKTVAMVGRYLTQLNDENILVDVGGDKLTERGWYICRVNVND